jgi:2-iminobutanoate/2-iminopropanoate deaminase
MPYEVVSTMDAPKSPAHYSQATTYGKLVCTAGQVSFDPKTGEIVGSTIEDQTKRALDNLKAVLEVAGCSFLDVLKVNIYLKRTSDFAGMNSVYVKYFKEPLPARTTVQAELMDPNLLIELDAVACKK